MDWEKWYTPPKLTNVHLKRSHFKGTVVFQPLLFRGHVSCPGGSFKLLASVCSKVQIRHHCMCWREHLLCPMNSCPINAFKNQDYSDYSDYSIHEVSWKRTRWILDGMITEDHTVSLWSSKWFFESIKSSRNWRFKKNISKKLPLLNHILNPQQKNRSLAFNKHSIPCPPTSSQHFSQAPVGMAWCTKVPPFDIPLMAITPTTRHQRLANEKPAKVTRGTGIPTKKKGNDAFKP